MQIKLYGNGHSCNIPVQEIIDKYWKDETAPFSFEMSTTIGDETIAATAMLGEENPDTYPSMFPFAFVKEIAAFRGDKIFWKKEA